MTSGQIFEVIQLDDIERKAARHSLEGLAKSQKIIIGTAKARTTTNQSKKNHKRRSKNKNKNKTKKHE